MELKQSKLFTCSIIFCCMFSIISCTSDDIVSLEVQPIPSPAGAYEEDCKWIYSKMNHDYLWREDLPDSLDCDYGTDPVTFYKSLLSPKDRFSYCENNTLYVPSQENRSLGYAYQEYVNGNGISFRQVLYITCPELSGKGLRRGDFVIHSDHSNKIARISFDASNAISVMDTIEASSIFGPTRTVYLDSIYNIKNHKVGYLCYLEFNEINELIPVFKRFYDAQVDEMILDLRYNPGGYVSTCKYLSNSLINEKGYNKIFQQCTYNDVLTREYEKATGSGITISSFTTPDNGEGVLGNPMYGLNLKRLYVLTSKYSASASEAAIISMRPFMDVILIGEQTYGKGVGSWTIRDNRFKYQLQPITMRYHNAVMETTPDEGLVVDYYVPDGYDTKKKELGDLQEPLLAKAIGLISGTEVEDISNSTKAIGDTRSHNIPNEMKITKVGNPSFFRKFNESRNLFQQE